MLTFVTVAYRADIALLKLQARSLARFALPEDVAAIRILINDADEDRVMAQARAIVPEYGPLADRVEVLSGDSVLGHGHAGIGGWKARWLNRLPGLRRVGWRGNNGYRMQQAMKLASARIAPTDEIVLLDAKNVLLAPVARPDFFGPDGGAITEFLKVVDGPHRNWLAEALRAMDAPLSPSEVAETTTYVTPYAIRRSLLAEVLAGIEARHGPVEVLFASKKRPSEFMLINVHCLTRPGGLRAHFTGSDRPHGGFWPDHTPAEISATLDRMDAGALLSIGMHYRALGGLSPEAFARLTSGLAERGLGSPDEIAQVLRGVAQTNPNR